MTQLVVRDLPDDVTERLKRRAKKHGRSLEAEVREILGSVTEEGDMPQCDGAQAVTRLLRRQREIGVTKEDVDALNESMHELRLDQRMHEQLLRRPRRQASSARIAKIRPCSGCGSATL